MSTKTPGITIINIQKHGVTIVNAHKHGVTIVIKYPQKTWCNPSNSSQNMVLPL